MKLNLGCGHTLKDGWLNLDKGDFGQQVVRDVLRGLPFGDDTFDEILADNLLEHIPPGDDSVFVMNEIYRVSRPGARVTVIVPHAFSQGAHQDPTHCNYFVPRAALYWNQDLPWPKMYGSTANFNIDKIEVYGEQDTELFIRFTLSARPKASRGLYQPLVFPADKLTSPSAMVADFHKLYYDSRVWQKTYYRGIPTAKCPLDLWIYQEIIQEVKPALIIETGTYKGGSALFLAEQFDGRVLSIDIESDLDACRIDHPRIGMMLGDSVSDSILCELRKHLASPCLVILDSDHHKAHVLKELDLYAPLVTVGSYLIVEDTNVNGNPIEPDFGPGPGEAVAEWLPNHPEFEVDESRHKFLMTFNKGGYLKRVH